MKKYTNKMQQIPEKMTLNKINTKKNTYYTIGGSEV